MPIRNQDIRQSLYRQDPEFRKLAEEHSRYESQLENLLTQEYHNAEDLIQEAVLKKLKLQTKDRMEMLLARCQHQQSRP
jgi:uncharacterized protein YdcH (DUF465 family)